MVLDFLDGLNLIHSSYFKAKRFFSSVEKEVREIGNMKETGLPVLKIESVL